MHQTAMAASSTASSATASATITSATTQVTDIKLASQVTRVKVEEKVFEADIDNTVVDHDADVNQREDSELASTKFANSTNPNPINNNNNSNNLNSKSPQTTTGAMTNTCAVGNSCAGCRKPIKDRFIFSVIEQKFHQDCVRCADCSLALIERCYTYDGKLYCRLDYLRRYGPKCSACQEPIKPTEWVQRIKENLVYHLNCFVCQDCKRHLLAGEHLHLIDDKRLLCERDFMNITAAANHSTATTTPASSNATAPPTSTSIRNTTNNNNNNNHHGNKSSTASTNHTITNGSLLQHHQHHNNHHHHHHHHNHHHNQQQQQQQQQLHLVSNHQADNTVDDSNEADSNEADDLDELDEQSSPGVGDGAEQQVHYGQHVPGRETGDGQSGKSTNSNSDSLVDHCSDELVDANGKRRGQRTSTSTIKPKQLETLRRVFETASKPKRHIQSQAGTGVHVQHHNKSVSSSVSTASNSSTSSSILSAHHSHHQLSTGNNPNSNHHQQQHSGSNAANQLVQSGGGNGGGGNGGGGGGNGGSGGGHKPTRVRTVLNEKQLQTLRDCYAHNPRPDALMKEQLVDLTGLSSRVIRVWFQNKRCKDKKKSILYKQMQQHEKDGRHLAGLTLMRGVPMVASSPIQYDDHSTVSSTPDNVQNVQSATNAAAAAASRLEQHSAGTNSMLELQAGPQESATPPHHAGYPATKPQPVHSPSAVDIHAYQPPWKNLIEYAQQQQQQQSVGQANNQGAAAAVAERLNAASPRYQQLMGQIHGYQQQSEVAEQRTGNSVELRQRQYNHPADNYQQQTDNQLHNHHHHHPHLAPLGQPLGLQVQGAQQHQVQPQPITHLHQFPH